jgi:hypothetical protein
MNVAFLQNSCTFVSSGILHFLKRKEEGRGLEVMREACVFAPPPHSAHMIIQNNISVKTVITNHVFVLSIVFVL